MQPGPTPLHMALHRAVTLGGFGNGNPSSALIVIAGCLVMSCRLQLLCRRLRPEKGAVLHVLLQRKRNTPSEQVKG